MSAHWGEADSLRRWLGQPLLTDTVEKVPNCSAPICLLCKNLTHDYRFGLASITLPRSPASFSSGSEAPHIFTRKSRVGPKEILILSAKRLFQQYRSKPAYMRFFHLGPLCHPDRTCRIPRLWIRCERSLIARQRSRDLHIMLDYPTKSYTSF